MTDGTVLAGGWYIDGLIETALKPLQQSKTRRPRRDSDSLGATLANNAPAMSGEFVVGPSQQVHYLTPAEERVFAVALSRSVRIISKGAR